MAGQRKSKTLILREERLLEAVLSSPTYAKAAAAAGVSERTIRRAMKRPGFVKRVAEARKAAITSAVGSLSALAAEAFDAVRRSLTCGTPAVELKAGLAILIEASIRGGEYLHGLEELNELREQVAVLVEQARQAEEQQ